MCASERVARQHRMNIGTIVEAPLVKVRLVGKRRFGPMLGEVEEYFVNLLRPGRHVHVRRPAAALPAAARERGGMRGGRHRRADGAGL